ncbi:uncharacterized protein B0J16DRAFT_388656 [Fusarium flagelliforme]|uniref:uncharacterized protein n=1 Tax=Fusarium flagelliforme TaxID=2675880 RepID=UPI001E8D32B1|nr:uncharacterized protein B0J16DRAFT_388656 [Fusarium flagelliforme]KAH7174819.1 hypothetical protein B0J16DRAFT_388656 [Fusarium flagelliforme]
MLLKAFLSVAVVATTAYAGPCQPRSSIVSSETSVTLSDALSSTIPGSSTGVDSTTATTDTKTESTGPPTTTDGSTIIVETSTGTTDSSIVTETPSLTQTSSGTEISSATETSLIIETEAMTSGSTTETSVMTEPTSTAESSTIYESTTTTSGSVPVPTFSLVARSLSAQGAGVEGYTLASSSSAMSYATLMRRLFNTAGQVFCAFVKAFGQTNDPAEPRVCESDTEETDNGFGIRILKCVASSAGTLDCSLTSSSGLYKYFIAHSDGTLRITTKSEEPGYAYVSLEAVET